jgi:type VI secretion system ImpC/EvpB family protein
MSSTPFQLGILGDFAGIQATGLSERKFFEVDRDRLEAVIRKLGPEIELGLPFCPKLAFAAVTDFHPDRIAERVPALLKMLEARSEVGQPATMRQLLEEAGATIRVAEPMTAEAPAEPPPEVPEPPSGSQTDGDLLDSIVAGAESAPREPTPRRRYADPELDDLIARIAEAADPGTDFAEQDRWRTAIDRELAARMRAILHHPTFRALEASWRSLQELIRIADTDGPMRVWILHMTLPELVEEQAAGELQRLVYEERAATPGADRFDFLVADYRFGEDPGELRALARLAELAERAAVPLLAGAADELATTDRESPKAFSELRRSHAARRIGLCYPRVLLRLPYGPESDPIERFEFDETTGADAIPYLWANGASAVARMVARAVSVGGGLDELPRHASLAGLPFHVYQVDGEHHSQHPAEHILTESSIKKLIDRGLLPIVGVVGSDEARIVSLRSLSGPSLLRRE